MKIAFTDLHHSMPATQNHLLVLTVGIAFCLLGDPTWANPTGKNPNTPLAVHGTLPEAKQIHAKLAALIVETEKFISETNELINKRGPEAASPKKLLQYRGSSVLASQENQRLAQLGEPAAIDFEVRFSRAAAEIHGIILKYISTPPGQKLRPILIAQLKKTQPNREKQLAQVREKLEKNDIVGAEAKMAPLVIEVEGLIRFLYESEFEPYLGTYHSTLVAMQQPSLTKRREDAKVAYAAAIANNAVDVQAFKDWGNQVATQISTSGQANVAGQSTITNAGSVDGPGAIDQLKAQWLAAHARLQRLAGLHWAMYPSDSSKQDPTVAMATEFQTAAVETAKRIIEADATSIAASDVAGHYQKYMVTLSDLASLADFSRIETSLDAPLQKLLAKNSLYQQQVEQYRRATRDVFEFDKRLRNQTLAAMQAKYPAADATVRKQVESINQQPGLLPPQSNIPVLATLMGPANLTMATVSPRVINQTVSLQRIRSLAPEAKVEVASLDSRTYGSMLKVSLPAEEQSRIASLLLVDPTHPPLTVGAWYAMQCVMRANYDAAGGQIVGCQLEPVVTRFAAMPDTASTIVPLGTAGAASIGPMQLNQMMMRVDVMPEWVIYPLGFYVVTGNPGAATAAKTANMPPVTAPPAAMPPTTSSAVPAVANSDAATPSGPPSEVGAPTAGTLPTLPDIGGNE